MMPFSSFPGIIFGTHQYKLILLSIVALAIWSFIRIPIDTIKTIFRKG